LPDLEVFHLIGKRGREKDFISQQPRYLIKKRRREFRIKKESRNRGLKKKRAY